MVIVLAPRSRHCCTSRAVTHASVADEADGRSQCHRRSCMLAPVLLAVMAFAGKALAADSIPAKAEDKLIAGAALLQMFQVACMAHDSYVQH